MCFDFLREREKVPDMQDTRPIPNTHPCELFPNRYRALGGRWPYAYPIGNLPPGTLAIEIEGAIGRHGIGYGDGRPQGMDAYYKQAGSWRRGPGQGGPREDDYIYLPNLPQYLEYNPNRMRERDLELMRPPPDRWDPDRGGRLREMTQELRRLNDIYYGRPTRRGGPEQYGGGPAHVKDDGADGQWGFVMHGEEEMAEGEAAQGHDARVGQGGGRDAPVGIGAARHAAPDTWPREAGDDGMRARRRAGRGSMGPQRQERVGAEDFDADEEEMEDDGFSMTRTSDLTAGPPAYHGARMTGGVSGGEGMQRAMDRGGGGAQGGWANMEGVGRDPHRMATGFGERQAPGQGRAAFGLRRGGRAGGLRRF